MVAVCPFDGAGARDVPVPAGWFGPRIRKPATSTMIARPSIAMMAFLGMMLASVGVRRVVVGDGSVTTA